jgi:hypothetical protein
MRELWPFFFYVSRRSLLVSQRSQIHQFKSVKRRVSDPMLILSEPGIPNPLKLSMKRRFSEPMLIVSELNFTNKDFKLTNGSCGADRRKISESALTNSVFCSVLFDAIT